MRPPFIHLSLPQSLIPGWLRDKVPPLIRECLKTHDAIPKKDQVAHLPTEGDVPYLEIKSQWAWSLHLQVNPRNNTSEQHNLFYHAWLHDHLEEDRLGNTAYPLIGLFPTNYNDEATLERLIRTGDKFASQDDVAFIGINELKWADQHVHKEIQVFPDGCKFESWNIGGDMARFYLGEPHQVLVHSFYAVAVDLVRRRVNVSLVSIVAKPLEDALAKFFNPPGPAQGKRKLPTLPDLHKFFGELHGRTKGFGHVLDLLKFLLTQEKPVEWACAACTTRSPEGEPACITCGRPRNGYESEAEYLALKNDRERKMYLKLRLPESGMTPSDIAAVLAAQRDD